MIAHPGKHPLKHPEVFLGPYMPPDDWVALSIPPEKCADSALSAGVPGPGGIPTLNPKPSAPREPTAP